MNSQLRCRWRWQLLRATFKTAVLGCLTLGMIGNADGQNPVASGLTRPGWPNDDGKILFAADDKDGNKAALGGTVYTEVLKKSGSAEDPWATGIANFLTTFQPGIDFTGGASPALDTRAEFLYLYQVINDRRTNAPIESIGIKLQVDMRDITSWGYFDGVGFGVQGKKGEKGEALLGEAGRSEPYQAVSFGHELGGMNKAYKHLAPLVDLPQGLRLVPVPTRRGQAQPRGEKGKIVNVVWDALDPANNPDYIMLLTNSDFDNSPSVRAIWNGKNVLERNNRSTVFGFTSNLPPTTDLVRIRTTKEVSKEVSAIRLAGTEVEDLIVRDGTVGPLGKVHTPRPETSESAPPPDIGFPGAPAMPPALGTPGGGGGSGPFPVAGGIGSPPPPGGGGGGIGAIGSGGGQSSGSPNQNSKANINFNVTLNNQQEQNQNQNQTQTGGSCHCGGNVIPEPATLVSASLGLPALFYLWRRGRKNNN
jgi:hypothetical protein